MIVEAGRGVGNVVYTNFFLLLQIWKHHDKSFAFAVERFWAGLRGVFFIIDNTVCIDCTMNPSS